MQRSKEDNGIGQFHIEPACFFFLFGGETEAALLNHPRNVEERHCFNQSGEENVGTSSVGATAIAAAREAELRRGVNGEVTPPASYRPGICAQSTHNLTLKLTEPLAWRIRSHTR